MKLGKKICETLKAIRRNIAEANEIDYQPTECHHEGDCAGTCPKCESETRWLERQLRNRQALGKAVTIAGLSVALGAMSSCLTGNHTSNSQLGGSIAPTDTDYYQLGGDTIDASDVDGDTIAPLPCDVEFVSDTIGTKHSSKDKK